jgi:adenylate cyclase
MSDVRAMFSDLRPVSLDDMNERASLQKRKDHKYVVPLDDLTRLIDKLGDDHDVLEIDGERLFEYESTYFDTPSLRCFTDHVRDRAPRFKARTRCYVTTGDCFFEVKVKQEDGETAKRNVDHDPAERASLEPPAQELLEEALPESGIDVPDEDLDPSLTTAFRRVTIVSRDGPERTTFDFQVTLTAPEGETASLGKRYVIAETKTPDGEGTWDQAFRDAGLEPVSLSKYRVGTGLLHAPDEDRDYARDIKELFRVGSSAGIEIERKFLVPELPGDLGDHESSELRQGYLAVEDDGTEVRVRERDGDATLTVKKGSGQVRSEQEIEIDNAAFARFWPLTEGRRLEKRRHLIPAGDGLTIELDVYSGDLEGLATAEVEFASEDAARSFDPPGWLGRDVTDDERYKSRRLAVDGLPD